MNISLIYPEAPVATIDHEQTLRDKIPKLFFHGGMHFTAPLALSILGKIAIEMGHNVKTYYELGGRKLSYSELEEISRTSEVVGISTMTLQATRAYEIGSILKNVYEMKGSLVYGGKHITGTYELKTNGISQFFEQAFENGMADAVFVGEATSSWPRFLSEWPDITERIYTDKGYGQFSIPIADRSQLNFADFIYPFSMLLGSGCLFSCKSCSVSGKVLMRELEEIVGEHDAIIDLQKKTGMDSFLNRLLKRDVIFFTDNDIHMYSDFYQKSREKGYPAVLRASLESVKKKGKFWVSQAGYNAGLDTDFLDFSAKTGCIGLFIGFETALQENLRALGKGQNRIEMYRQIVKNCEERGILVMSNYMLGLPYDEIGCGRHTFEAIQHDGVHVVATNFYTPLPGSDFFMDCYQNNRLLGEPTASEWWRYNGGRIQFTPERISVGDLYLEHSEFRDLVYNPVNVLKRLAKSKLPLEQKAAAFIGNMLFGLGMRPREDEYEVFQERMRHYGLEMQERR